MRVDSESELQDLTEEIIQQRITLIYTLLKECEDLAKEASIEFHFRPAIHMGGWYSGMDEKWIPSSRTC